jgi:hypothetical protein
LELGPIADLEKLIAHPDLQHQQEFTNGFPIDALRNVADSDVLPEDIRTMVKRVLELHETASEPFLGMNIPNQRDKPRMGIDAKDAEEQARQDWSNDEWS